MEGASQRKPGRPAIRSIYRTAVELGGRLGRAHPTLAIRGRMAWILKELAREFGYCPVFVLFHKIPSFCRFAALNLRDV